ncbi:MAG: hypothetical protein DMG11_23805 [Acidobacteria bacterium]|nr:MAG: hypothetical protein DMG11_23805 [Acidobacteriota bacterium]
MQDRRSLDQMLAALEKRTGKRPGATVIVDRGMAFDENLEQIRKRGLHYLVAGLQSERNQWLDEFENDDGWENIVRTTSAQSTSEENTRRNQTPAEGRCRLHSVPQRGTRREGPRHSRRTGSQTDRGPP